jgi:hydrogenase maturation protease
VIEELAPIGADPAMSEGPRFAVLGLGNRIQGDEALGALAVEALHRQFNGDPEWRGVDLIDGGTVGLGLLPYLEDLAGLIVVDVIDAAAQPGTLVELDGIAPPAGPEPLSVHDLGAAELLGALLVSGRMPGRVRIIGLQPARIDLGTELSAPVAAALPRLCARIQELLVDWGAAR